MYYTSNFPPFPQNKATGMSEDPFAGLSYEGIKPMFSSPAAGTQHERLLTLLPPSAMQQLRATLRQAVGCATTYWFW